MNKYIVEFIGTFFLVLTVVAAVNGLWDSSFMAPLAIWASLMVMIYAGGHISGGHFNPAVSLAALMRWVLGMADFIPYIIAQVLGAILAAVIATGVLGFETSIGADMAVTPALVAEILGTFALAWVVLQTATTKSNEGNSHYGLAIWFTVTAMAYALWGVSWWAFNPAVAVWVAVAGMASWSTIWIYLVGCFGWGALAALAFKATYPGKD